MARMANPYPEASEVDTLVPAAVQHVRRAGYPSNKGVRKSLDINEKPNRKKNWKFVGKNPKPTKAQLLAEPVTHRLYFMAAQNFDLKVKKAQPTTLHKLRVDIVTPRGRL